jgi:hypothetical protein
LSLGAGPLVGYRSLEPPAHDEVVETSECQKPDENDEIEEKARARSRCRERLDRRARRAAQRRGVGNSLEMADPEVIELRSTEEERVLRQGPFPRGPERIRTADFTRARFTAVHIHAQIVPSTQVTPRFSITPTSIEFRVFPYVMLGMC